MAVVLVIFVLSAPRAHAEQWGTNYYASRMKQMMEQIYIQIQSALLGSLKMAAVQTLNMQIDQLIGGGSGQPLFITNYRDFLYSQPVKKTDIYMNDLYTLSMRGTFSSANYMGLDSSVSRIVGNYQSYLVSQAKMATAGAIVSTFDLDQYSASPTVMFQEGDWRALNAFFSNPANNPFGYSLMAEQAYSSRLAMEQEIQRTMAQSSGYLPAISGGRVVTPAGAIAAVTNDIKTLGNRIIAAANNPGEFLSGVIVSFVNRTVNSLVQRGIGEVQATIQREVGSVVSQVNGAISEVQRELGPGARFMSGVSQRVNVGIGSSTPAPPTAGNSASTAGSPTCSQKGYTCVSKTLNCDTGETETADVCFSPNYKCCKPR